MPFYRIKHITRYTYAKPVVDGANQIMLYPVQDAFQEVQKHELSITANPLVEPFLDYFGNQIGVFTIVKPHSELYIQSLIEIITHPVTFPEDTASAESQWAHLGIVREEFPYTDLLKQPDFIAKADLLVELRQVITPMDTPMAIAQRLSTYIYQNFEYQKGITSIETDVDEIWRLKAGVCQDFAHILLVMLRMNNIPARYVSGYICPKNGDMRGEGATHAWVDVYIPFYGWLGVDPTNNCLVSDRHVRLAVGRNFSDCTPVKGTYKGSGAHKLEVSVKIENGVPKSESELSEPTPVFGYTVQKEVVPITNSYRQFMEMQMQMQQQQ